MMIKKIKFHRFKRFEDQTIELRQQPITLLAGGNNSGKSSVLHGLAVWEFCRTVIEAERGTQAFLKSTPAKAKGGVGLGDDEFSPINVPSLNHLWTNLRTQKSDEPDGYTLKIACFWDAEDGRELRLEFGLSLANDRLFVKTTATTLREADRIPRIAYLPPFAGITDREMRMPGAIRRRRIGEGLAGAVLRNLLLDMYTQNLRRRAELRGERLKILDRDLRELRQSDPWELLTSAVRDTFRTDLRTREFSEEYHSYIRVDVVKGEFVDGKFKAFANYNKRDLMVEGSGFLQWLSVYTLATNPLVDMLLLDEPDAHLHASLQQQMLDKLRDLAELTGKQVLVATHSTEILRSAEPEQILELRAAGRHRARYLSEQEQKVGLLAGLGSDYSPRIDSLRRTKKVLFLEGRSDADVLRSIAGKLDHPWPGEWTLWISPTPHQERLHLIRALSTEIAGLTGVSLRDRDDTPLTQVGADLLDRTVAADSNFTALTWRRRNIESYLLWPDAIAEVAEVPVVEIRRLLSEQHALSISENYLDSDAPEALLVVDGKKILKTGPEAVLGQVNATAAAIAEALTPDAICEDLKTFFGCLAGVEAEATTV
jgi:predicted ATPase